ncbi:hypothetical protein [Pyruvatibacter mobilis]|uniref:hypothetical protein n=1 Tax=Pyruvatibacter mobilis TaxID=1712261 RepID=UPI003C7B5996
MMSLGLGICTSDAAAAKWWPEGAALAIDFTAGLAMRNGIRLSPADLLVCNRPTPGWTTDAQGNLNETPPHRIRLTNRGLLVEEARENLFLHSGSPATRSLVLAPGSYTLSVHGQGHAALSGSATGTASPQMPLSFELTTSGTVTVTPHRPSQEHPMHVQLEAGPFASSPITTGPTPVTRAGDAITFADAAWLTPKAATLLVEWEQVAPASLAQNGIQNLLRWRAGNTISRLRSGSRAIAQIQDSDQNLILNAGSTIPSTSGVHRMAVSLAPDDAAVTWSSSIDGSGGIVIDTSGTAHTPVDTAWVASSGQGEFLNGLIRKLVYWPTRLSDSTTQQLVQ